MTKEGNLDYSWDAVTTGRATAISGNGHVFYDSANADAWFRLAIYSLNAFRYF